MGITENKITQAEIDAVKVESAPDSMIGMSAREVKRKFDNYPHMLAGKINNAFDSLRELEATSMMSIIDGDAVSRKKAVEGDAATLKTVSELIDKVGVATLTHSMSGGIHSLIGTIPSSGYPSVKFKATAVISKGEMFRVNGESYTPIAVTGETPQCGFVSGAIIRVELDVEGKKMYFS